MGIRRILAVPGFPFIDSFHELDAIDIISERVVRFPKQADDMVIIRKIERGQVIPAKTALFENAGVGDKVRDLTIERIMLH